MADKASKRLHPRVRVGGARLSYVNIDGQHVKDQEAKDILPYIPTYAIIHIPILHGMGGMVIPLQRYTCSIVHPMVGRPSHHVDPLLIYKLSTTRRQANPPCNNLQPILLVAWQPDSYIIIIIIQQFGRCSSPLLLSSLPFWQPMPQAVLSDVPTN
ncbi:hypothetical protein TESG_05573 [Trichophyton tonsurans CBS 112818]|uniref:Uncharacterized protein n=1 Tax=Trichophyton tonsurans (strain CBS 112818) TaxID=647933 RepID=F2S3N8_TRIT1|nr:hypothetical protein TESG_05573 [Trichophyton tonsurans CBS 112818]